MAKLFLISAFFIFTAISHNSLSAAEDNANTRIYEVYGMDCPACHSGLEKLVKKVPDVENARANWVKKTLTVVMRSGGMVDDGMVYDAIKRANLTVGKRLK